jgi:hypothetical protein
MAIMALVARSFDGSGITKYRLPLFVRLTHWLKSDATKVDGTRSIWRALLLVRIFDVFIFIASKATPVAICYFSINSMAS